MRQRYRGPTGHTPGTIRSEGDEVEALLALGRLDEAQEVCDRLADHEQRVGDPWQRAIGARCRALVAAARAATPTALDEFERAVSAHRQLPMPLEGGRTRLAYATVLRRSKHKRRPVEQAEDALRIFRSLGAQVWLERAQSERSRIAPASAGLAALTPTEARLAALVAAGRTNKEAAAEMFLSVKTVEANLSRVYAKLQVRSRSELARRLPIRR